MNRKGKTGEVRHAAPRLRLAGMIMCMLAALSLGPAMAETSLSGVFTPIIINNGPGHQADPHVSGNLVSYTSTLPTSSEIRYFDFSSSLDQAIPSLPDRFDFLSDVSGGIVVWTRVESGRQSIWMFDTSSAGPAVELATVAASNRRAAAIGGNTVAWQDLGFSAGGVVLSEIVVCDRATGATTRLTEDTSYDRLPSVSPGGDVIVWEKAAYATAPPDIWQAVKGSAGWTASQVTNTPDPETFADTNGALVVYGGNRSGNATGSDIYWKPVAGGGESQLALVGEQRNPNISGNVISFEGRNLADLSPNWDIYLYDLSSLELYRVTDTPVLDETLNDISVTGTQIRLVWSVYETDRNVRGASFAFPVANAGAGQAVHTGNVVTLDGSASSDPDLNYPLSYSWNITSKPAGSGATLSDPSIVNPSFTADLPGDYVIRLVVADSLGLVSASASVTISTTNTPPVADAGPDQAIALVGTTVHLDGSNSYDLESDLLTYQWTIDQKPAGSAAVLSNAAAANPSFTVDVYGDYVIALVVSDPWSSSAPDSITTSFYNIKPIADAGGNQSVVAGAEVQLDGIGSSDANGDTLTYTWSFVSKPAGSSATLANASSSTASFITDEAGAYVVSLVVNDGLIDSDSSNVTIVATGGTGSILSALAQAIYAINHLPPDSFKNDTMANTLTNKINAAIQMIDQGLYADALDKLQNDIVAKTDGCATAGSPDKNDWITNCTAQGQVYPFILEAIDLLKLL
ncbi:MAG: PKD domain-containing protein [Armatimonadota bacterium]|nr:PKD domain-containing protein [Armatimonadota bacterium]